MSWTKQPLSAVLDFAYGKGLPARRRKEGTVPVYGSAGVIDSHDTALVKGPGVIVGRKGTVGAVHWCDTDFYPIDTTFYVVPTGQIRLRYAYYLLRTLPLSQMNTDVAVPGLNRNNALRLKVAFPSFSQQDRIIDILSTYDELIENNLRRVQLLEQSAQLLYKEWFVLLRFPGHEHVKIKDGVPEGWMRKRLGELTSFLKRGIAPHYDDDAEGLVINQKCIRNGRLNLNLARHQAREFGPERQVQVGDVLVNSTGEGTLGRIAQVKAPVENCTVDTHVTIVRPKPSIPIHYFGLAVMSWETQFSTMGRGATNQTELSPTVIGETEIVMPSKTLREQFELFAEPIYSQVTNFIMQIDKLKAARDLLLPRLMNGEVVV